MNIRSTPQFSEVIRTFYLHYLTRRMPVPVTTPSKAWDCGRLLAGIVDLNPAGGVIVCLLLGRGLCDGLITRPEESYRVWSIWVWSWILDNEQALTHWGGGGLLRHGKKQTRAEEIMKFSWRTWKVSAINDESNVRMYSEIKQRTPYQELLCLSRIKGAPCKLITHHLSSYELRIQNYLPVVNPVTNLAASEAQ